MIGECDSCRYKNVEVKDYSSRLDHVETKNLCDLCASTPAGNAYSYPSQFPERRTLMALCYIGNALLAAIHQSAPVTFSADEFEHLALMGMTKDGRFRVGDGGAERVLAHARRLATAQAAPEHVHDFAMYEVCRICGRTEADLNECHHCNDDVSIHNQRCWWCLRPREGK